jgi:tetratricopeptide (TPR) repeat protein
VERRRALVVGLAVAVALALGVLAGGVLAEPSPPAAPAAPPPALAERALGGVAAGVTAGTIRELEAQVRTRPRDASLLTELGFAYQLRWRESADASYLTRSETALRRALRAGVEDANALLGLGSLALIRHEFRSALSYGRDARRLLPGSSRPYGVIGDALVELGRYGAAFRAYERMVTLRPSLASYARIAYARELTGDRAGAAAAMRLALEAAAGQPEPTAWTHVELAKLELGSGRARAARSHVRAALAILPGYPSAQVELARTEAALGRPRQAIAAARRAAEAVPTVQAVVLLADLLDRARRPVEASRERATVAVIERLLQANGVQLDLEAAVYRADLHVRPLATVALARRARAERPSIYGDDALAWALARAGRCDEAVPLSERALRLGTKDPLLFFHRGYVAGCAGDRAAMRHWYRRALDLSPDFSIRWAPVASAALRAG